ncbi:MAG: hypothetical protein RLY14_3243 [Planctomycetota bacterium]|jgi:hypothetical protein
MTEDYGSRYPLFALLFSLALIGACDLLFGSIEKGRSKHSTEVVWIVKT